MLDIQHIRSPPLEGFFWTVILPEIRDQDPSATPKKSSRLKMARIPVLLAVVKLQQSKVGALGGEFQYKIHGQRPSL
ncbi:MAG: hypothetical protein ACJAXX_000919 [Roseivirga sp.]|jgi:hypothetical protein